MSTIFFYFYEKFCVFSFSLTKKQHSFFELRMIFANTGNPLRTPYRKQVNKLIFTLALIETSLK